MKASMFIREKVKLTGLLCSRCKKKKLRNLLWKIRGIELKEKRMKKKPLGKMAFFIFFSFLCYNKAKHRKCFSFTINHFYLFSAGKLIMRKKIKNRSKHLYDGG